MKHDWKVGDAYTTKEWGSLNIVGRITSIGVRDRIQGAEMWYKGGQSLEFHTDRWYQEDQLIPLVPEQELHPLVPEYVYLDQTINEIYATVEKVQGPICTNPPDSCNPPCPEHAPIDQWEGFDPNIQYS